MGRLGSTMPFRPMRAKAKHIVSLVAGQADILLVPDLEAGNMLAKQLEYLADADGAGIVLGARVPIVLTSRADKTLAGWRPAPSPCCSRITTASRVRYERTDGAAMQGFCVDELDCVCHQLSTLIVDWHGDGSRP